MFHVPLVSQIYSEIQIFGQKTKKEEGGAGWRGMTRQNL